MSSHIHVFSISGYNFNLPKKKNGRYQVSYLHHNACNHDQLAIDRLKMLFQKDGVLFEQSCQEIPNSSSVKVDAHLIFFSDRAFDFKKSERSRIIPAQFGEASPGITLSFTGADLHSGEVRIPDDKLLKRIALFGSRALDNDLLKNDPQAAQKTLIFANKKAALVAQVANQYKVIPSECVFTKGKLGVNPSYYYFKAEYSKLFAKSTQRSGFPRHFGGFLELYALLVEVEQDKAPPVYSAKEARFIDEVTAYINSGALAKAQEVVSIADIYSAVEKLALSEQNVLEISVFSHAWNGGPVMVNSSDNRLSGDVDNYFQYDKLSQNPSSYAQSLSIKQYQNLPYRSPYDKDARPDYDFCDLKDRCSQWINREFTKDSKVLKKALEDEQIKWFLDSRQQNGGDKVERNLKAQAAFTKHSRVLFWGCSAVRVHKRFIQAFYRHDRQSKSSIKPNRNNIKQRLSRYWSQQLSFWGAEIDAPQIGEINLEPSIGITRYAQHLQQVKLEKPPSSLAYQQPHRLKTSHLTRQLGFSSILDKLPESPDEITSTDLPLTFSFRGSQMMRMYNLSKAPKAEDWKSLQTNFGFMKALRLFGPFPNDKNSFHSETTTEQYWQRYMRDYRAIKSAEQAPKSELFLPPPPIDQADMDKIIAALIKRQNRTWSVTLSASLVAEYLSIYHSYNWLLAFAWGVKVYGAPSGTGSLFQNRRKDALFKQRIRAARRRQVPKHFYPLNEIAYKHKVYKDTATRDHSENNQAIINFYRECFGVDTLNDELLNETMGYMALDPSDTSFWNFITWPVIRDIARVDWLHRKK